MGTTWKGTNIPPQPHQTCIFLCVQKVVFSGINNPLMGIVVVEDDANKKDAWEFFFPSTDRKALR